MQSLESSLESSEDASVAELVVQEAPTRVKLGQFRLLSLSGFWLGISAANAALQIFLVANRVKVMFPNAADSTGGGFQGVVLGTIQSVSGLVAGFVFPALGALSDRHSSRFGRRTPFMLWGTLGCLISFALMAVTGQFVSEGASGAFAFFVISVMALNVGVAWVSAPYTALIPDLVSPEQVGAASGWMGFMAMLGNFVGSALGLLLSPFESSFGIGNYFAPWCVLLAIVFLLTLLWTVLVVREKPHISPYQQSNVPEEVRGSSVVARTWIRFKRAIIGAFRGFISPFRSRDFLWVFFTKFLMTAGVLATSGFLVYWIEDCFPKAIGCEVVESPISCYSLFGQGVDTAEAVTSFFLLPLLLGATIASLAAGFLSDKFGRKGAVYIAGGLQAGSAAVMILIPYFWSTYLELIVFLGLFFGLGYGAFLSVDFALVVDVLPSEKDAAKDMGVWHMSVTLANITAPFAAGSLQTAFSSIEVKLGYTVIFAMSVLCFVSATILISLVKKGGRPTKDGDAIAEVLELDDMNTMNQETTADSEQNEINDDI